MKTNSFLLVWKKYGDRIYRLVTDKRIWDKAKVSKPSTH